MDSYEINKIAGAALGTVFAIFSVSLIADSIFDSPAPETPGYAIEITAPDAGPATGGGAAEPESILPLLATANVEAGAAVFKRCQACHTADEGGANRAGPNLWDIVNRPIASHEGFSYSAAMTAFSEGGSVHWDYEHLDHFVVNPKGLVAGTAMAFAGLKKLEDRANLIAYLRTLSNDPKPLPAADAAPAAETAPAEPAPAQQPAAPAEQAPAAATPATPAEPAPAQQPAAPAEPAPAAAQPAAQ